MIDKNKFYKVATSGPTIDGREINSIDLEQAAQIYNREKYAARVWIEHMRSYSTEGDFPAVGDVLALKTEKKDGKTILLAKIAPLEKLNKIHKEKQKLYTSIELTKNLEATGGTYLTGLSVTDSPASLGTEVLGFTLQQDASSPKFYSHYEDFNFEASADAPQADAFLSKIADLFKKSANNTQEFKETQAAIELLASKLNDQIESSATTTNLIASTQEAIATKVTQLEQQLAGLAATPSGAPRPSRTQPHDDSYNF